MGNRQRDPVEASADRSADLYEIADWEARSLFDKLVTALYYAGRWALGGLVVLAAIVILLLQLFFGSLGALGVQPLFGALAALSAIPALVLAAYIWYADVTTQEPLTLLVGTFLLGVLFAGFAGILNTVFRAPVTTVGSVFGLLPFLGQMAFFFLIVGPVEEAVKLLAVRLYGQVNDPPRQRIMLDLAAEAFVERPLQRWRWLAEAAIIARHRLEDLELALEYARLIAEHTEPGQIPFWARDLRILVLEDMGELEAARVLIGGLLASGEITDPHEIRFLERRLEALERRSGERTDERRRGAGPSP